MDLKLSLGSDVSESNIRHCLVKIDSKQEVKIIASRTFDNSHAGFLAFHKWLKGKLKRFDLPLVACMEATGVYYEHFAYYLRSLEIDVAVILPNTARKFLDSLGTNSKNDSIDAIGLATMGAERKLKLWQPPATYYVELREMTRQRQALSELKTAQGNRLHAIEHSKYQSKLIKRQLKSTIKMCDKQIAQLDKAIKEHIASDPSVAEKVEKICLIKGVGITTVAVILAETNGFELFQNQKQLISYSGYDVVENQSGKRVGKTKISKRGNSRIRRALHMPAFSVITHKQRAFSNIHQRLIVKHGIKMKGYVAVQKKILTTIYALWKKNEAYDNDYILKLLEEEQVHSSSNQDKQGSPVIDQATQGRLAVNDHSLSPLQILEV